ncbi:helix-turn-helix domain-containing protein [Bosea sp. (in: a-proteobacteria)]|uniref:helix-turn-helix domain-containing protein n=1 Tax=Bosea sp. (in: a-proteobacteria) TaxID=1871050 RepID=UPI002FC60E28
MQLLSLEAGSVAPACLSRAIAEVIESVGHPEFDASLFALAHRFAGAEHLTAFLSAPGAQPRTLLAENAGPGERARSIAKRYIARYWHLDPANEIVIDDHDGRHSWALRLKAGDIPNMSYRSECYLSAGLSERFSLIQKRPAGTLRVNFYCGRKESFSDGVIAKLTDCAPLLMAALWRHNEAVSPVAGADMASAFRSRLEKVAPTLSGRELDVCALVATGVTSEGIALELGVGVNTVLTYRKRAYARLSISSQNELMRILM